MKRYGQEPYVYSPKLVCFIDFLGFRNLITNMSKADADKFIQDMEKKIEEVVDLSIEDRDVADPLLNISVNSFSDCVCYSTPLSLTDPEIFRSQVYSFVDRICHMQANLTQLGIVVRGAMVVDMHYSSPSLIFSKALFKAYMLESTFVDVPAIYFDKSFLTVLDGLAKAEGDEDEKILNNLSFEVDKGFRIVNYLSKCNIFEEEHPSLKFFQNHKNLIEKNLKENKSSSVQFKYLWLGKYHNAFLDNCEDVPEVDRISAKHSTIPANIKLKKVFKRSALKLILKMIK